MGTGDHRMNKASDGGNFMMGQSGSFMGGGGGGHSSSVSMSTSVSSMSLAQMSLGSPSVVSTMDQQQQQQHPFFNMERGNTGGSGGGGYIGGGSLADQAATQNITQGPVRNRPLHILYGHDAAVTSVAVNTGLDLLISGSEDWTCIIHTLKEGAYVRTLSMHDTSPSSFTGFDGAFDGAVGGGGGNGASAGGNNGSSGGGGGDGGVGDSSPESTRGARGGNAAKESSPFGVWGDETKRGGGGGGGGGGRGTRGRARATSAASSAPGASESPSGGLGVQWVGIATGGLNDTSSGASLLGIYWPHTKAPSRRHVLGGGSDGGRLSMMSVNGRLLSTTEELGGARINAIAFSVDGKFVISGGSDRLVTIRSTHDLKVTQVFDGSYEPPRGNMRVEPFTAARCAR